MKSGKPPSFSKVSELDLNDLKMTFRVHSTFSLDGEPDNLFERITGRLNIYDKEFHEFKKCICKLDAYLFRADQLEKSGLSAHQCFDSIDDSVIKYYEALYYGDNISDAIADEIEPGFGGNLLIIEKVLVRSDYRGRNLGLLCALKAIELFGGNTQYIALRPFPFQFTTENRKLSETQLRGKHLHGLEARETKAFLKLQKHWCKMGFKKIGEGDVFLLSTADAFPTASDLFK